MYTRAVARPVAHFVVLCSLIFCGSPLQAQTATGSGSASSPTPGQAPAQASPQPPAPSDEHAGHDVPQVSHEGHDMAAMGHASWEGSGKSWLPKESPMYAYHGTSRGWMWMGHGNAFLQYLRESGDRGSDQAGSINWLMGMAQRPVGAGSLLLRGMVSFEPWTIDGCGYPDLLATGERCAGEAIHDRQHPHDLLMEVAAQYQVPVGRGVSLQVYGGPVGEPALGPVAFMHRISGLPNALAPITHHWFDSTHITFGVVTAGVLGERWKAEGSVFNGREPDENRVDMDVGPLDSYSGRFWFAPAPQWAFQVSAGRLNEAEPGHDGEPPIDLSRVTASGTYHRTTLDETWWTTTVGWGRNQEGGRGFNAMVAESSLTLRHRDSFYGRFEWAQKSGHDLAIETAETYGVAKLQGGYTRYLTGWRGLVPGVGAALSTGIVPERLTPYYGSRFNTGINLYLTLRPRPQQM